MGEAFSATNRLSPSPTIGERLELTKINAYAATTYYSLSVNEQNLTVMGLLGGLNYAFHKNLALAAYASQSYSTESGLETLFTNISLDLTVALTGSLWQKKLITTLNNHVTSRFTQPSPKGLRFHINTAQYSFNTSGASIPFSGAGIGVSYQYPLWNTYSLVGKVHIDSITNSQNSLHSIWSSLGLNTQL